MTGKGSIFSKKAYNTIFNDHFLRKKGFFKKKEALFYIIKFINIKNLDINW
jgi:hypothetical protein